MSLTSSLIKETYSIDYGLSFDDEFPGQYWGQRVLDFFTSGLIQPKSQYSSKKSESQKPLQNQLLARKFKILQPIRQSSSVPLVKPIFQCNIMMSYSRIYNHDNWSRWVRSRLSEQWFVTKSKFSESKQNKSSGLFRPVEAKKSYLIFRFASYPHPCP